MCIRDRRAAVEYFAKSAITPLRFQEILTENLMRYSDAANDSMLDLLDSHDTARFLTVSGGDTARLRNAAAFLFTFVGMPCTYYGTEIGMTGENDPDCRKAFDWDPDVYKRQPHRSRGPGAAQRER